MYTHTITYHTADLLQECCNCGRIIGMLGGDGHLIPSHLDTGNVWHLTQGGHQCLWSCSALLWQALDTVLRVSTMYMQDV